MYCKRSRQDVLTSSYRSKSRKKMLLDLANHIRKLDSIIFFLELSLSRNSIRVSLRPAQIATDDVIFKPLIATDDFFVKPLIATDDFIFKPLV